MPKFGAHMLIAELARQSEPDVFAGPINALRLGAIGPDLSLFLFDPFAKNPDVRKGINLAFEVLEAINEVKEKLEKLELAFDEAIGGPTESLADWFTGGLYPDVKAVLQMALEASLLAIKLSAATAASGVNIQNPLLPIIARLEAGDPTVLNDLITDPRFRDPMFYVSAADNFGFPFRHFGHPYTDDGHWKEPEKEGDYSNWWWMDMLHYRKTGAFASALRANAGTPLTDAYAAGYLTHVAGDICGHPFINSLVGGPFRNHAYRHMVLEGLADTWLWNYEGKGDIVSSRMDQLISLDSRDVRAIASQVLRAMREVYQPPMLPSNFKAGYPTTGDLETAYYLMKKYLELSTKGSVSRPTPPSDSPGEIFDEIQEILARNDPGDPPPWKKDDPLSYLAALLGWLFKGMATLIMIATLPYALIVRLGAAPMRWVMYLVKFAIYQIISALRTMLALMGYGYVSKDDFDVFGFLNDWIRAPGLDAGQYPCGQTPQPKLPMYWLASPRQIGAPVEQPWTLVGTQGGLRPDCITDRKLFLDQANAQLLAELNTALTPKRTVEIVTKLAESNSTGFGNAVDFSIALATGKWSVPDLDLDGDRGYGFRSWDAPPPGSHY